MKLIESIEDQMNHVRTYELSDGQRLRVDANVVRERGIEEVMRHYGLADLIPKGRLPVYQCGRKIGLLPAAFDPTNIKSKNPIFYDPRPGDFKLDGDKWIASPMLGGGDLEAVPGFVWEIEDNPTPKRHTVSGSDAADDDDL